MISTIKKIIELTKRDDDVLKKLNGKGGDDDERLGQDSE